MLIGTVKQVYITDMANMISLLAGIVICIGTVDAGFESWLTLEKEGKREKNQILKDMSCSSALIVRVKMLNCSKSNLGQFGLFTMSSREFRRLKGVLHHTKAHLNPGVHVCFTSTIPKHSVDPKIASR